MDGDPAGKQEGRSTLIRYLRFAADVVAFRLGYIPVRDLVSSNDELKNERFRRASAESSLNTLRDGISLGRARRMGPVTDDPMYGVRAKASYALRPPAFPL